ncbi:MAG: phosphoenolpyruvate--protein phosphotransferase [Eubacterium sp.]
MEEFKGKSVFGGIAMGKIRVYDKEKVLVKREKITDSKAEIDRYEKARDIAVSQLKELHAKAVKQVGEMNAMVFEVHQMLIEDEDFEESIEHIIETQKVNAEYAVACTQDNYMKMFENMDDDYMKERAADIADIAERLLNVLTGKTSENNIGSEPSIIIADDLAPSETVRLDKDKVLAFVTRYGSTNSHTAILARTMNIPALIGVSFPDRLDGKIGIVDGYKGKFIIEPDEYTTTEAESLIRAENEQREMLLNLRGKDNITKDGTRIQIYANIGSVSDVADALKYDAGGIGLFRSEFLYLEKTNYPTEEEQFLAYKNVAENMAGRKVIIRTLDIGADKKIDYFGLEHEENPAMGYRAIRICLDRQNIFKTQLRAIYRASAFGNISIMYPMIISLNEVKQIKKIVRQVETELKEEGVPFGKVEQGIMIETPAAVMISDLLAKEVEFFSIGTNDLSQYTLAIDRQNDKLDDFFDPHHEAIMRMIKMVTDNGHAGGCWVGICGELASDVELTEEFLRMGIDELSVSAANVLRVREKIRETDLKKKH